MNDDPNTRKIAVRPYQAEISPYAPGSLSGGSALPGAQLGAEETSGPLRGSTGSEAFGTFEFQCKTFGQWGILTPPITGRPALWAQLPGDQLILQIPPCKTASVLLLRHEWSGICEIDANGRLTRTDLFQDGSFGEILEVPIESSHVSNKVKLRVTGQHHPRSQGAQLWLLGVKLDGVFISVDRGTPISPACRLIHGKWGTFVCLRNDTGVAEVLAAEGSWGERDIAYFKQYILEGDVVLDIGANFGHHAVVFSKLAGTSGLVLAFEPQKRMYQLLNANLAINSCANATGFNFALGRDDEQSRMAPVDYGSQLNFGSLRVLPGSQSGERIDIRRADSHIDHLLDGRNRVDFIKIDVQAYELFVLEGARKTLERFHPTIFVEISPYWMQQMGYDYKLIYNLLRDLGYKFIHVGFPSLSAQDVREWDGNESVEWDVLAFHEQRLEQMLVSDFSQMAVREGLWRKESFGDRASDPAEYPASLEGTLYLYHKYRDDLSEARKAIVAFRAAQPADFTPMLDEVEAELSYLFARAVRPKKIVEVAPYMGWSTVWLLNALKDNGAGHLYSYDIEDHCSKFIPAEWSAGRWTLEIGDAAGKSELMPPDIDFLFIDCAPGRAFASFYIEKLFPKVRPGGMVCIHDLVSVEYNSDVFPMLLEWLKSRRIPFFSASPLGDSRVLTAIELAKKQVGLDEPVITAGRANPMLFFSMPASTPEARAMTCAPG